jgi:DnaJ like chaperone protein
MSFWSRLIEIITDVGGSVMAVLQKFAGPPSPPENSIAFTIGMIGLSAKMAKADGVVTGAEVRAFQKLFHVPEGERPAVARVFDLAKQDVAGFEAYARQIERLFTNRPEMLEDVLDGLFQIATADHLIHEAELVYLARVSEIFGFDAQAFRRIRARHVAGPQDAFEVLGLPASATDAEIKARYRELVRENHPDRHMAAGVPPELVDIATAKLATINSAYQSLMKERA